MIKIDKIDKYLKRFTSNVEYGTRSRYYTLPTGVVRVSDHVGRNSNAVISIIITNKNDYILHKHSSGELSNISYNGIQCHPSRFPDPSHRDGPPHRVWRPAVRRFAPERLCPGRSCQSARKRP